MGAPTNLPFGLTVMGVPILGSGTIPVGNNYWFVSSVTGLTGNPGTTYQTAFATIGAALAVATAGDVIVLEEGHAETIAAAGGVTVSTAGITIVGLGYGATRPTFTFSTSTAATWIISGASCSVSNIVGVCNIDQLVTAFSISGASCTLGLPSAPVEWQDSATNKEALVAVTTTAAATKLNINLKYLGQTGGSHCTAAVSLVGANGAIVNCDFYGKASTAWVNFATTACVNVEVYGYMYNSGVTNYTKDVVDTITGSTWFANIFDGSAGIAISGGSGSALGPAAAATVIADLAVATVDGTANALERDPIGNKTDAAVTAVGTTKSILAYAKGIVTMETVQSADSTNNAFMGDVVGNKTDTAVYVSGTTKSIAAYAKGTADLQERVATSATAVLANGTTIFTIAGGPIAILSLISECVVGGDAQAATVQYAITATGLSQVTISGASGSTANAAAHATVSLIGTTLATAAVYAANGVNLGMAPPGTVVSPVGLIKTVIGSGPTTTGTWRHIIRYMPLVTGVTVS